MGLSLVTEDSVDRKQASGNATDMGLVYRPFNNSGGAAVNLQEVIHNLKRERDILRQQVKELTDAVNRLEAEIQSLNIRGWATSHDWGASDLTNEQKAPVTKPPSAESI